MQTNTLSQMVAIHSWPDFHDLPRGHEANLSENEASVARGQGREAEARCCEARPRTRPKKLAFGPCWPRGVNISGNYSAEGPGCPRNEWSLEPVGCFSATGYLAAHQRCLAATKRACLLLMSCWPELCQFIDFVRLQLTCQICTQNTVSLSVDVYDSPPCDRQLLSYLMDNNNNKYYYYYYYYFRFSSNRSTFSAVNNWG